MVRYATAIAILSSAGSITCSNGFQPVTLPSLTHNTLSDSDQRAPSDIIFPVGLNLNSIFQDRRSTTVISASVVLDAYSRDNDDGSINLGAPRAYLEPLSPVGMTKEQESPARKITKTKRTVGTYMGKLYEVNIPLNRAALTETAAADGIGLGMTLRQIRKGRILSASFLDLETLRFVSGTAFESVGDAQMQYLKKDMIQAIDENFEGVIVSSVVEGGIGWNAGVRVSDVLIATSATIGDKLWPKSTLEGVRSALSSRKVMSNSIDFRLRQARTEERSTEVVEEFEMSLFRPFGIEVGNSEEGHVEITGFNADAPTHILSTLCIGDRIVAADSSVGSQMWAVSKVDGLVSACKSRLPGQPVRLRFERIVSMPPAGISASSMSGAVEEIVSTENAVASVVTSNLDEPLLKRCRDVIKRYTSEQQIAAAGVGRSALSAIPALVADRVMETLADASASLDAKTLALVMNAYLSCRMQDKAIQAFEAAVGISADATETKPVVVIQGKKEDCQIIPNPIALNLYTGTSLLRAHALNGDLHKALCVLTAMKGHWSTGDAALSATWTLKDKPVDTRCYNIALASATKSGSNKALNSALALFNSMANPSSKNLDNKARKDIVSYNTMIAAFARVGRRSDAISIYYGMREAGLKPDKITLTSVLKALVEDGEIDAGWELLTEMKKYSLKPDVVTYNTMIKALCDKLRWPEAQRLVTDMESLGIMPTSLTYGYLMNGLIKASKPAAALTLFEVSCADERTAALMENVQLYTTAITAASRLGDYDRAIDLVSRMKSIGLKPNMKTYTTLINVSLSSGQTVLASKIFSQFIDTAENGGEKPDGFLMTLGIKVLCETGDLAAAAKMLTEQKDGLKQMKGKAVMSSYNVLINAALKKCDFELARTALTELLQSGYIPSKLTFKTIVQGLGLFEKNREIDELCKEKFDFLLFVLDSITKRKIPCDGLFYSAVVREGARLGGLRRKLASILPKSRVLRPDMLETAEDLTHEMPSWQNIMSYLLSGNHTEDSKQIDIPFLRVRIGETEMRQVLLAEDSVMFKARSRQRRTNKVHKQNKAKNMD